MPRAVVATFLLLQFEGNVGRWTWDPAKDASNLVDHGLSLADGIPVLDGDPLAASRADEYRDGSRYQTVGSAGGVAVLFIVHTEPGEDAPGRIISVRRATRHERKAYEEGSF